MTETFHSRLAAALAENQRGNRPDMINVARQDLMELMHHFDRLDEDARRKAAAGAVNGLTTRFLHDVLLELSAARHKFPMPNRTFAALIEETGEVAKALLEAEQDALGLGARDVWRECVQAAAMACRVATEGDPGFEYVAPYPGEIDK